MSEDPTAVPRPVLPPHADPPVIESPGHGFEAVVNAPGTQSPNALTAPKGFAPGGDATAAHATTAHAPTADAPWGYATAAHATTADAPWGYATAAHATTAHAPTASSPADAAHTNPKRRRLRWLWWTAGSLAFASLAGLCAYLAVVADQWSDRVDDLTEISQDLGTQVAGETSARETAESQAADLQSQLDTATTRITTLANEEANANDHESVWIDLVDAMIECEEGWVKHSTVLKGRMQYTDTTTAKAEAELVAYCDGIKTDFTNFKAEIGK